MLLPALIITLSSISGAGGIALSAKSIADTLNASATNRYTQEKNERNLLHFQAVSERLNKSLENLGKQRWIIEKNFSVFSKAFEQIHNRPDFSEAENIEFPKFDFDEIRNISAVANDLLASTLGAVGGSALAAAAASGTTSAVMALGTASTGTKIAQLSGAAATKATLAALGGGAIKVGGGGIALGTTVLNIASLGIGVLVEGIALAYAGSVSQKQADKAKAQMEENEKIIEKAIQMQLDVEKSADDMRAASVELCNNVYKPLVMKLKELVTYKHDWNEYTLEEKKLVENNILVVQILHYLNNTPLYKVTKQNENGDVEEVEANTSEVHSAIEKSKKNIKEIN